MGASKPHSKLDIFEKNIISIYFRMIVNFFHTLWPSGNLNTTMGNDGSLPFERQFGSRKMAMFPNTMGVLFPGPGDP